MNNDSVHSHCINVHNLQQQSDINKLHGYRQHTVDDKVTGQMSPRPGYAVDSDIGACLHECT